MFLLIIYSLLAFLAVVLKRSRVSNKSLEFLGSTNASVPFSFLLYTKLLIIRPVSELEC